MRIEAYWVKKGVGEAEFVKMFAVEHVQSQARVSDEHHLSPKNTHFIDSREMCTRLQRAYCDFKYAGELRFPEHYGTTKMASLNMKAQKIKLSRIRAIGQILCN